MSYSQVNSGNIADTASSPNGVVFHVTVTATTIGNLGVLAVQRGSDGTLSSPTDNGSGNTWNLIGSLTNSTDGQIQYWWYCKFASSITQVNVNGSNTVDACSVAFAEFNSTNGWAATPLNVSDEGTMSTVANGTHTVSSNNITPLATDLLVSMYNDGAGDTPTISAGSGGWAIAANEAGISTSTGATAIEYVAATSGSAQGSTFSVTTTATTSNYAVAIAAFSQGGSSTPLAVYIPHRMPLGA